MTVYAPGSASVDPQQPWRSHTIRLVSIIPESPDVQTYGFEFCDESVRLAYRFRPGQFNMLYLPGIGEAAISISSPAEEPQRLAHTVRAVGNVTQALTRLEVGETLRLRGPFGSAWPLDRCQAHDVVIAAGGVGLAPLRSMVHHIVRHRDDFGRVWLLYGARTPHDLLYREEYETWREAGIDVQVTVDLGTEDWNGHIGVVPTLISGLRLDGPRTQLLTCGPEVMMRFVVFESLERNVPADQIHVSLERSMNCALGFCGHCQLGPAFVCKDGPVFTFAQMERYFHVEQF